MTTEIGDLSSTTHDEVMAKIERIASRFRGPPPSRPDNPATAVALDAWGERFITYLRIWDLRISAVLSRLESCEMRTLQRIDKAEQQIRDEVLLRTTAAREPPPRPRSPRRPRRTAQARNRGRAARRKRR